jgi:hypothetical protein
MFAPAVKQLVHTLGVGLHGTWPPGLSDRVVGAFGGAKEGDLRCFGGAISCTFGQLLCSFQNSEVKMTGTLVEAIFT